MSNALRSPALEDGEPPGPGSRLARAVVTTVFSGLCLVALLNLLDAATSLPQMLTAVVIMAVLLGLQLFCLTERSRAMPVGGRVGIVTLQAAVGLLPFLLFGQAWVGMPGFVAGGALLLLPAPWSVAGFLVIVGITGVVQGLLDPTVLLAVYTTVSTVLTGLIVYGLSTLSVLVGELHRTRGEMAQLAVFQERLRIARDLHDLLGYSLSAISLKSELTRRLVGKNPERALIELEEISDISRQALADVRVLASGYRDMSLRDETRLARSVLAAADIAVDVELVELPMDGAVGTALATVLREGVTNLLQHSKAEHCRILVTGCGDRVVMTIRNDGATLPPQVPEPHRGSGLRNLAARASALGGTLTSGLDGDGWFELRADLPLTVAGTATGADVIPLQQPAAPVKASRSRARSG